MAGLRRLYERLDPDANRRGKQFERVVRWWLENEPEYRAQLARVWLWNDWPERWGPDCGIDLVAEERGGDLWAIQAKCWDPEKDLPKSEIDSFFNETQRGKFAHRLIVTTARQLGRNAEPAVRGLKDVGIVIWSDLDRSAVSWPTDITRLTGGTAPKPLVPKGYQRRAIADVLRTFRRYPRTQLIMACGTGKTFVCQRLAEQLGSSRTLVLVPSLALLSQTLKDWTRDAMKPFEYLVVCSDPTVDRKEDEILVCTSELGFRVTTKTSDISRFLRKSGRLVVFSTYQSSPQVAAALRSQSVSAFDLAIADEAHRCAGQPSSEFAAVLDEKRIRARRRLFTTATPRVFSPVAKRRAEEADIEITSMDDHEAFGPVAHQYLFAQAIKEKQLTDYRVLVVGVNKESVLRAIRSRRLVKTIGGVKTDTETLGAHVAIAKATRRFGLRRIITFHSRVSGAKRFAEHHPQVLAWMPSSQRPTGKNRAEAVSGTMPAGDRNAALDRLRHLRPRQRRILTNARCLTEGVNVPALDGVGFVDPRRSHVDIVQAVGRAIRLSEDKTRGTVIVPVFLPPGADPKGSMEASVFRPVAEVLTALRSHDPLLGQELDEIRMEQGERPTARPRLPKRIILDLPAHISPRFARSLTLRIVEDTTRPWEFWLGLLKQYVRKHGDARVPQDSTFQGGLRLGSWCSTQRQLHRQGTLPGDRGRRLELLPGWTWYPHEELWEELFSALKRYIQRTGHARVPQGYRDGDLRLGGWCSAQRQLHRLGDLPLVRVRLLEALPGWAWNLRKDEWENAYAVLERYIRKHGHARVPSEYVERPQRPPEIRPTMDGSKPANE